MVEAPLIRLEWEGRKMSILRLQPVVILVLKLQKGVEPVGVGHVGGAIFLSQILAIELVAVLLFI